MEIGENLGLINESEIGEKKESNQIHFQAQTIKK